MPLEKKLEDRCVKKVEADGGQALKLKIDGVRGFPDRTILFPGGKIWFAEFKREKGGVISAQQTLWADRLRQLGFEVYFPNTDEEFDRALETEKRAASVPRPVDRVPVRSKQRPRTITRRRW